MEAIDVNFLLVKVDENLYDVAIFAENHVLKAFQEVYDAYFVENSVFDNKPVAIVPDFPNERHAEAWKQYWIQAFAEPENACKTCATVNQLFDLIEQGKKIEQEKNSK
ncbi:MAG: hypothetical protein GF334_03650 [Candidatus Altiarchaeales archaeon]|nr:hypothetical protein [Candidatus Altiarchaeales archaeon]